MKNILEQAVNRIKTGGDFAMVTVIEASGSVPGKPGARILVSDTETTGTVGGGAIEKHAIELARECIRKKGTPFSKRIKTADLDMTCGGTATLFVEPFFAPAHLFIFGGGHISKELVPIAASIGFAVTVIDNRTDFSNRNDFPKAYQVLHNDSYSEAAKQIRPGSFAIAVTHGHAHDAEVLLELARINPPLPYIGMIGSKRKVPAIMDKLREKGIEPGKNIYAPIGLRLGGNSPSQIALSIAAEILGVLNEKPGLPHMR
jgi:xanthine dehydrogenase accessory factor